MTTVEWIVIGSALFAVYLFVDLRSRRKRKANRPVAKAPRKAPVTPQPQEARTTPPSQRAPEPPRKAVEASAPKLPSTTPPDKPSDPETFENLPVAQQAEIVGDVSSVVAAIFFSHRVLIDEIAQHHSEGRDGVRREITAVWKADLARCEDEAYFATHRRQHEEIEDALPLIQDVADGIIAYLTRATEFETLGQVVETAFLRFKEGEFSKNWKPSKKFEALSKREDETGTDISDGGLEGYPTKFYICGLILLFFQRGISASLVSANLADATTLKKQMRQDILTDYASVMRDLIPPHAMPRDYRDWLDDVIEYAADLLSSYMSNSATVEDLQGKAVRLGNDASPLMERFLELDKSGQVGKGLDAIGKDRDFIKYVGLAVYPWVIQKALFAPVAEDAATRKRLKTAMAKEAKTHLAYGIDLGLRKYELKKKVAKALEDGEISPVLAKIVASSATGLGRRLVGQIIKRLMKTVGGYVVGDIQITEVRQEVPGLYRWIESLAVKHSLGPAPEPKEEPVAQAPEPETPPPPVREEKPSVVVDETPEESPADHDDKPAPELPLEKGKVRTKKPFFEL